MSVQLTEPPNPAVRLTLDFENTFDGVVDVTVAITSDAARLLSNAGGEPAPVSDANMVVGSVIEARLPLRLHG